MIPAVDVRMVHSITMIREAVDYISSELSYLRMGTRQTARSIQLNFPKSPLKISNFLFSLKEKSFLQFY